MVEVEKRFGEVEEGKHNSTSPKVWPFTLMDLSTEYLWISPHIVGIHCLFVVIVFV